MKPNQTVQNSTKEVADSKECLKVERMGGKIVAMQEFNLSSVHVTLFASFSF